VALEKLRAPSKLEFQTLTTHGRESSNLVAVPDSKVSSKIDSQGELLYSHLLKKRLFITSGETVGPEQAISIRDELRLYIINGTYASFEENI